MPCCRLSNVRSYVEHHPDVAGSGKSLNVKADTQTVRHVTRERKRRKRQDRMHGGIRVAADEMTRL